jgi:RNA polymerase sigma-70 factor (family 1)
MQSTLISDAELISHLEAGDEHAFQEIYERYWHRLYKMAASKVDCQENAKEIVQDVFLNLWHRRKEVHIDELDRYLFTAVKYGALKSIRNEIVRRKYQETFIKTTSEFSPETENTLAFEELNNAISQGMTQLPDKVREIFRLNRMQHKSAREISEMLKIPERTVEHHITQALHLMRSHLKDYLISLFITLIASVLLQTYL